MRVSQGERIGLTIWSGVAITIFPLTDDYEFALAVGAAVPVRELSHLVAWLRDHHTQPSGVWLVSPRRAGERPISYEAAVVEALRFGWVDSTYQRVEVLGDLDLVHEGKSDAFTLRAVTEGGVEGGDLHGRRGIVPRTFGVGGTGPLGPSSPLGPVGAS